MKIFDPQLKDDKAPKTSLGIRKKAKGTRQTIQYEDPSPKTTFQCDSAP